MFIKIQCHGSVLSGGGGCTAGTQSLQFRSSLVIPALLATGAMAVPPRMRALLLAVNALLRKRRYHAMLALLKGFRNGAV